MSATSCIRHGGAELGFQHVHGVKAYWTLRRDVRKMKSYGSDEVIRVIIPLIT